MTVISEGGGDGGEITNSHVSDHGLRLCLHMCMCELDTTKETSGQSPAVFVPKEVLLAKCDVSPTHFFVSKAQTGPSALC